MRTFRLGLVAGALLGSAACDFTGDFLFAGPVDGVPGIVHLGELTPVVVEGAADLDSGAIYAEVGPTGTAEQGGVTFTFQGTGGDVCVWVDPELVFWNQSVSARRPVPKWSYPDNVFDDGDIDIDVGLAAYYTGTPGEEMGDFEVRYEDSLGNPIAVELNECTISSAFISTGAHSGRGAPEYCTISNTTPGVTYMAVLETWSIPLDDDRMGFGVMLADGSCRALSGKNPTGNDECLILGEAVEPRNNAGPWYGLDEVQSLPGSQEFELTFCDSEARMSDYCVAEAQDKDCTTDRCFCGDPANTPTPAGL